MRSFERIAVEKHLIPPVVLMENAGKNVAEIILKRFHPKHVAIFCGGGNNGGDGFVVARHLFNKNVKVKVFIIQKENKYKDIARLNLKIIRKIKVPIINLYSDKLKYFKTDLIVDALLGIGISGKIREPYKQVIEKINSLKKPVVSIDIPSGIDTDTGFSLGAAVKAKVTVTMTAMKQGLLLNDGKKLSGKIYVVDIGIKLNSVF